MTYAAVQNAAGKFVAAERRRASRPPPPAPTGRNAKDFYLVITNAPGEDAWPITATNFILMYKKPKDAAAYQGRARLLQVGATRTATRRPKALDYVPLPAALVAADRGSTGRPNFKL